MEHKGGGLSMIQNLTKSQLIKETTTELDVIRRVLERNNTSLDDAASVILARYEFTNWSQIEPYRILAYSNTWNYYILDQLKLHMILISNCNQMRILSILGMERIYIDLQDPYSQLWNIVNPQMYNFSTIFKMFTDVNSVLRAIVPFIYWGNPLDFPQYSDSILDIQYFIFNQFLDMSVKLRERYPDYFNDSLDTLTYKLLEVMYNDAIGNDSNGMEVFFNYFVEGKDSISLTYDGASVLDDLISLSNVACYNVIDYFENRLQNVKVRLAIYMRYKMFRYASGKDVVDDFYLMERSQDVRNIEDA